MAANFVQNRIRKTLAKERKPNKSSSGEEREGEEEMELDPLREEDAENGFAAARRRKKSVAIKKVMGEVPGLENIHKFENPIEIGFWMIVFVALLSLTMYGLVQLVLRFLSKIFWVFDKHFFNGPFSRKSHSRSFLSIFVEFYCSYILYRQPYKHERLHGLSGRAILAKFYLLLPFVRGQMAVRRIESDRKVHELDGYSGDFAQTQR